jgi:hypothetical protein
MADIEPDTLSAELDSTMRQYLRLANASNVTRVYYDASLRAYRNEPFRSPKDVFYNLYGYACGTFVFAPIRYRNKALPEPRRFVMIDGATTDFQGFYNIVTNQRLASTNAVGLGRDDGNTLKP